MTAFIEHALPGQSMTTLAFVLVSALLAGLARGFSGFGGALIFVPLAAAALGPKLASALYLIIDGLLSLSMLPNGWRRSNRPEVYRMAFGALFGIPAGTWLLATMPSLALRWVICLVVAGLLTLLASGWRFHGKPRPALTAAVGALAGVFGGVSQMTGPPVVAYWLGGANAAATARANFILFFTFTSAISVVSYSIGGLLTQQVFWLSLLVGPFYGLGMIIGTRMFGMASETAFRRICFGLIAIAVIVGLPLFDAWRH